MNNNTKTAELILSGDQYTGTALKLITPVLLNTDPSEKTWFFGIVQTPSNRLLKIIDEIINFLEANRSPEQDTLANYSSSQLAVESQLETMLQNINSRLGAHLNEKEIDSIISNTNIILGLQNEDSLSLAGRGKIYAMMIRAKQDQDAIENNDTYEVLNLLKQSASADLPIEEEGGLFTHFLSGKFSSRDTLMLSTKNLWDKLQEEDLVRGIALLPPHSAVEFIKNNLPKWRGGSATSLLLKYTPRITSEEAEPLHRQQLGHTFKNSIDELVGTEEKTEKILSTPTPFKKITEILTPDEQKKPAEKLHRQGSNTKRNLRKFFDILFSILTVIFTFLTKLFSQLFALITNRNKREKTSTEIKKDISFKRDGIIKRFNSLPRKSKIILVLTVFLVFVFSQSILIFSIKKSYENKRLAYNAIVEEIKKSTEDAEASMIYGDDRKAKQSLTEAEEKLATLSKKNKGEKEQAGFLRELINEKWTKLYHVIDVSEPRLIADLGNTGGEFLIESNGSLYILSPTNSSILKMNPDNGQVSPLMSFDNPDNSPIFWRQADEGSVIIFQQNHLPDNSEMQIAKAQQITLANQNISSINCSNITERVKDLKIYNNKLYALGAGQNQIWKHSSISGSFTNGSAWKKDDQINLKNALSLALDGSIYIVNRDGSIEKIFSGEKTDFKANIPKTIGQEEDLSLEDAKIWTGDDVNFIYILDKTHDRIIVFDKNGKLVAQYTSSIFNNLKDFNIQEKEHKIYVLNDTQVYGIIASHIDFRQADN